MPNRKGPLNRAGAAGVVVAALVVALLAGWEADGTAAQTGPVATFPAGALLDAVRAQPTAAPSTGGADTLRPALSDAVRARIIADPAVRQIEVVNPRIVAAGAWEVVGDDQARGKQLQRANAPNTSTTFTFRGPSVTWLFRSGPDGGIARVTIDGQSKGTVDQFAPAPTFDREVTYDALGPGTHTLRIEVTGTRHPQATNAFVTVEAFVTPLLPPAVFPPGPLPTPGPPGVVVSLPMMAIVAPPSPPPLPRDGRYFPQTAFRVELDSFWEYFVARGGVDTFGFPTSRTVTFLGCATQFFQRQLLQQCPGTGVRTMNLLDPELMPYDQINRSQFPAYDAVLAGAAPPPGTADYGRAVLDHLRASAPDAFEGLPVRFLATFMGTVPGVVGDDTLRAQVNLEVWGFPTSRPAFDPTNRDFVYQRFQRGIMHYDRTQGAQGATRGILLADWFKTIIIGDPTVLPDDLEAQVQAADSRYYTQYCRALPSWVCRPERLAGTLLLFGFEQG